MKSGSCIVTDKELRICFEAGIDLFNLLASKGVPLEINEYGYCRPCENIQIFCDDDREHEFSAFGWAI